MKMNFQRGPEMVQDKIGFDKKVHRLYGDWADDVVEEAFAIARSMKIGGVAREPKYLNDLSLCVMDEALHQMSNPDDFSDMGYLDIEGTRFYLMAYRHEYVQG